MGAQAGHGGGGACQHWYSGTDCSGEEERIRKEMEETEMVPKKMFSCFYCGGKFGSKKGKDQHMDMCNEKH